MSDEAIAYFRRWKEVGPILEALRDRDIREAGTAYSLQMMQQAFRIALRDLPPCDSSGLVEWQRYMARGRQRG